MLVVFLQQALHSQGFMSGDMIASACIGVPHLNKASVKHQTKTESFKNSFNGSAEVVSIKGPNPIALKYEYALSNRVGLGISVSWWSVIINVKDEYDLVENKKVYHYTDTYSFKMSSIAFGIRPNYHIPLKKNKCDLFFGCAVGIARNDMSVSYNSKLSNGSLGGSFYEFKLPNSIYLAPTVGYRAYVSSSFGLNVELGYEKGAILQAGIVFRFRPFKYEAIK